MKVGKAVKIALASAEMNQEELSKASGYSKSYISQVINGSRSMNIKMLQRFADAMGIKPSELISYGED